MSKWAKVLCFSRNEFHLKRKLTLSNGWDLVSEGRWERESLLSLSWMRVELTQLEWVNDVALLNTHTNWLTDEVCSLQEWYDFASLVFFSLSSVRHFMQIEREREREKERKKEHTHTLKGKNDSHFIIKQSANSA